MKEERERDRERGTLNPMHYVCLVSVYMTVYNYIPQ